MGKFRTGAIALGIGVMMTAFSGAASAEWESDRLYVSTSGSGDPVLVIPGLTSSPDAFCDAFDRATVDDHTYYWMTLGGFGGKPSPQSVTPFTMPAASEVGRFIDEHDLQDVSLIGHSMGGVISLLVAVEHPDRIGRIMIIDSVPFLAGLMQPGANPEQVSARGAQMSAQFGAMSDDQFSAMMRQGLPIQATSADAQSMVWGDIERSDRRAITAAMSEIFTTDYRSILPMVEAEVTVLVPHNQYSPGSTDQLLARYQELYEGLENVEFKIIRDSRHFIMLDQPDVFAREVESFLGGSNE